MKLRLFGAAVKQSACFSCHDLFRNYLFFRFFNMGCFRPGNCLSIGWYLPLNYRGKGLWSNSSLDAFCSGTSWVYQPKYGGFLWMFPQKSILRYVRRGNCLRNFIIGFCMNIFDWSLFMGFVGRFWGVIIYSNALPYFNDNLLWWIDG